MTRSSGKAHRATSHTALRKRPAKRAKEPRSRIRLDVDARRAQLVDLGLTEFGTRTYDEVSIDGIAQIAGISKGLLYHYFPTKRAFYVACVREAAARLLARIDAVPDDGTPLERLARGLDAYLGYVRAHGRAYATLMRSGIGVDREVAAIVDQTRLKLLMSLASGMGHELPTRGHGLPPLLQMALHGWVGLAEAMSIAWVEACVARENSGDPEPASATDVRNILANALVAILQSTQQSG